MSVQRCPECGGRLHTNYCDICMRKVPFGGIKRAKQRDPWDIHDGSSAHCREKNHECISFDYDKKPKKTTYIKPRKKAAAPNKKGASVVAIIVAVFSLLPALVDFVGDAVDSVFAPTPEYSIAENFVAAGDAGAEDVPNVIAGEIYNANGIRITADDAGLNYGEYAIFFTAYNDTDQKINVSFDNVSANGFMLPFDAYQEVKSGKSEPVYLTFYSDELEKAGITQVSEVAVELYVYDTNSYEDIVAGELITLQTEAENIPLSAVDTSGLELYNDGSTRVVLQGAMLDDYGDCRLDLYMENLSGSSVSIYSGQVFANGEEVSGFIWDVLRPNTRAFDTAYIYELDERVDLDIEDVSQLEEITMDLYVEYTQGYDILETYSEKITFAPNAIQ